MSKLKLKKLIKELIKEQSETNYTGQSLTVLCGAYCGGENFGNSISYGFGIAAAGNPYIEPYMDQIVPIDSPEALNWLDTYDFDWLGSGYNNEFVLLPPQSVPICSYIFGAGSFVGPQFGEISNPCVFLNSYGDICNNAPAACYSTDEVEPDEPVFNENMSCDEMQASGVPGSSFPEMMGYNETGLDSMFCQTCNDPESGDGTGSNYYGFNTNIYLGPLCNACCNTNYTGPYSYVDDPEYDPSIYGSSQTPTPLALPTSLNKPTKPGKPDKQKAKMQKAKMQKLAGIKEQMTSPVRPKDCCKDLETLEREINYINSLIETLESGIFPGGGPVNSFEWGDYFTRDQINQLIATHQNNLNIYLNLFTQLESTNCCKKTGNTGVAPYKRS